MSKNKQTDQRGVQQLRANNPHNQGASITSKTQLLANCLALLYSIKQAVVNSSAESKKHPGALLCNTACCQQGDTSGPATLLCCFLQLLPLSRMVKNHKSPTCIMRSYVGICMG
jgi:hypothetical protein